MLHRVTTQVRRGRRGRVQALRARRGVGGSSSTPTLRAYVQEGLKTWRKRNAAMVLATQTVEDFASADLLRTVVESCPTKLLLANPALDRRVYADLFQLNDMELDLLTRLFIPRQQLLQASGPPRGRMLALAVNPRSYWIYTNTPIDNARVAETIREHGFEAGLDRLVASPHKAREVCDVSSIGWSALGGAHRERVGCSRRDVRPATGIREVSASSRSLIALQTRLRFTTMVVLPEGDEILDVICGTGLLGHQRHATSRT